MADLSDELFGPSTKPSTRGAQLAADLFPAQKTSVLQDIGQGIGNLGAGVLRGAGSIGSTLLYPVDKITDLLKGDRNPNLRGLITGQQPLSRNEQRRLDMDAALQTLGAQPESLLYKGGKLGGEIAGTAGAGGAIAGGLRAGIPMLASVGANAPVLENLAKAIASGGFKAGAAAPIANMATRIGGGAISGGASAGLINPEDAGIGTVLGGALPVAGKLGGIAGQAASNGLNYVGEKLMQSALKPTIAALKSGDAAIAVRNMLDNGLNVSRGGVENLRGAIGDLNDQISQAIGGSNATVSKQKVLDALNDIRGRFTNQVDPMPDLAAIQGVSDRFAVHPLLPSDAIPVQLAQDLKQGTYKVLAKKYGLLGSADTEAQKGLARGLKEGIAAAVPEVGALNGQESDLIKTLGVTERRVLQQMNNNPMGLAGLAHSPAAWAAMMADKSALFKSLAARMANSAGNGLNSISQQSGLLGNVTANPAIRSGLLSIGESNQ